MEYRGCSRKVGGASVHFALLISFPISTAGRAAAPPMQGENADHRVVIVPGVGGTDEPEIFVPDEFIVELKPTARQQVRIQATAAGRPTATLATLAAAMDRSGAMKFDRQFPHRQPEPAGSRFKDLTGYYVVKVDGRLTLDAAMQTFARDANVDHVEKIGIHPMYIDPNDPYYEVSPSPTFPYDQWHYWNTHSIDAELAWDSETGDPSVVVAVLDSGTRYFHVDLGGNNAQWGPGNPQSNGNIWVNSGEIPGDGIDNDGNGRIDDTIGYDFVSSATATGCTCIDSDCGTLDNDPDDFNGHGTHTAGTVGAITNNNRQVAGVAGGFSDGQTTGVGNGSKVMPLRIGWHANCFGQVTGVVRMDYAAQAMDYVRLKKNAGVNIAAINCSWGSSNSGGINAAVDNLLAADVMIVAAAGNSNSSTAPFLGTKTGVLNVAATDINGNGASFTNWGTWVDVAAPGVNVVSTYRNPSDSNPANHYIAVLSGTSMSAPHVCGIAALLESCNPSLSGPDKFNLIINNTDPYTDTRYLGTGIANGYEAMLAGGCGAPECNTNPDCDDGLFCNGAETCVSGNCQAGTPSNCNDGIACTTDSCNEATDSCDHAPNHGSCNDGLFCNGTETCNVSTGCQAGTAPNCDDGIACTTDSCNEGTDSCDHTANNAACDDGLYCNGAETCNVSTGCQAGTGPNCDDGIACTVDSCNEGTDSCDHAANHAACDDGLFCNGAETCNVATGCQAGSDPCPGQLCDEPTDTCVNCQTNGDCDDGLFCNGTEICNAGSCGPGSPPNCDDGIACTGDSCNEGTDSCDHAPNNAACDDGLFCNGVETCNVSTGCQAGTAPNCDDGIACTGDSCNEGTDSCDHTANNAACDDGLYCNGAETCNLSTGCVAGTDPCAPDPCDEATDTCGSAEIWLTFTTATTIPGVGSVANEDIVAYDLNSGTWSLVFDGSDVGLSSLVIDGMAVEPDGEILLSFTVEASIPGLIGGPSGTTVDDSDIVRFTPTSLGSTTAGTFTFHFDGSDVGLTADAEDIDAISLTSTGDLVISVTGNFSGTGASGVDEDLFQFTATSLGSVTAGSFAMYFDGSDVGLSTTADEDVDAAGVTAAGTILLSTLGPFSVTGVSGDDEDVVEFSPTSLGTTTSGTYQMYLDLSALGIDPSEDVGALELVE